MSSGFRVACVLMCVLWAGMSCTGTKQAGKDSGVSPGTVENIQVPAESGVPEGNNAFSGGENKAKGPAAGQSIAEQKKRMMTRQQYAKARRAWIAKHQNDFHALPSY